MWWASYHNPTVLTQIKRTKFWLSPAHCCASVCLWCAPAENWALVRLRRPLEAPPSSTCAPKGLQAAERHMWPTEQGADPFLDEHAITHIVGGFWIFVSWAWHHALCCKPHPYPNTQAFNSCLSVEPWRGWKNDPKQPNRWISCQIPWFCMSHFVLVAFNIQQ